MISTYRVTGNLPDGTEVDQSFPATDEGYAAVQRLMRTMSIANVSRNRAVSADLVKQFMAGRNA